MDTSSMRKKFEVLMVIAVLGVSGYLLFPSLSKIFDFSTKSTSESNTESAVKFTRDLYAALNMNDGVVLPFRLEFSGGSYKIYSQGLEYTPTGANLIDEGRELPSSGYIEIKADGTLDAQGLKYKLGGYVCSQTSEVRPVCVKG